MNDIICGDYNYDEVSIMNLIVVPERYDGKIVQITGVLSLEFESAGLYFNKEAFEYSLPNLSVNIDFPEHYKSKFQSLNGKYVVLEGLFESRSVHEGVKVGYMISKVCHIQVYPKINSNG